MSEPEELLRLGLLEDPRQKRANQIKRELQSSAFQVPGTENRSPKLTDDAWDFIKRNADATNSVTEHYSFDGDWGNWNWLWSEIYKRCL